MTAIVVKHELFNNYHFPNNYHYAIEDWDFFLHKWDKMNILEINDKDIWYFYTYNKNSLTKTRTVFRSRLEHALSVYNDPKLRTMALKTKMLAHYYQYLYIMAKLWFPDLLEDVKKIKYKSQTRFALKILYVVVKIGVFNHLIRKWSGVVSQNN